MKRWTSRAVAGLLVFSLGCCALGLVFSAFLPVADDQRVVPIQRLWGALWRLQPKAWMSLGVLGLFLTPVVRLLGMAATFRARGRTRALGSACAVLVFVVGAVVYGLVTSSR